MHILRARSGTVLLAVSMMGAVCITLVFLQHWSFSGAGAVSSNERDTRGCLEVAGHVKDAHLPANQPDTPAGHVKDAHLPESQPDTPAGHVKDAHLPASQPDTPAGPFPSGMDQDDPALAAYIRRLVMPPSPLPYNLTHPEKEHFSQYGQTEFLMKSIFPGMKGGFFLEVGAVDGEALSNTLYLERQMGWRGLLIEANPTTYRDQLHKHRKAYSIQAALSPTNKSTEVNFRVRGRKGVTSVVAEKGKRTIVVPAFPLFAILKAVDVPVIDYLSMDIEGLEPEVLDTVPWDRVKVRVMHVERGTRKGLVAAMKSRGMHFIGTRTIDAWFVCSELYRDTIQNVKQKKT